MKKAEQIVITALYAGGSAVVAALVLLTAAGAGQVLFSNAMLPMELQEVASAWLAVGFLPVLLVSAQFHKMVRRKIVFLPAAVCLLTLVFWVGVWTVGMFRSPVLV